MSRREFPARVKAAVALRAAGHCERCGIKLRFGEGQYDHVLPDALGGEPVADNCELLCSPCHRAKTTDDVGRIRKADRQRKVMEGRKTTRPMPGSRASRWKRRLDGTTVER
jgi:5-methylcytosine-specific restriction endonuclease McrA